MATLLDTDNLTNTELKEAYKAFMALNINL